MNIFAGRGKSCLSPVALALSLSLFLCKQVHSASFIPVLTTSAPHQAGTATLLPDGRVLLVGGGTGSGGSSVMEIYDPALGSWSGGSSLTLTTNRANHTATLLQNGKVLIAGGSSGGFGPIATAEIYDPVTRKCTPVGNMRTNRINHTAVLLQSGRVLVAGGTTTGGPLNPSIASAELFDPVTGTWAATGPMSTNRVGHTISLLSNGKVLVAGGRAGGGFVTANYSSAELYDPSTGTWTPAGNMSATRSTMTATLLPNGKLLVAGGRIGTSVISLVELYDLASGTWTVTNSLNVARSLHTATLLPNGRLLVTGGQGTSGNLNSAEVYDPATGIWTTTTTMVATHYQHAAVILPSGRVLIAGGTSSGSSTGTEFYDYAPGSWTPTEAMSVPRGSHTATLLPNGKLLVVGGDNETDGILASAEMYDPTTGHWASANPMSTPRTCIRPLSWPTAEFSWPGEKLRPIPQGSGYG